MGRSHVCMRCKLDLAGTRAPPDPHYGLPVVVCPSCGLATVRRPYAGDAMRRAAARIRRSLAGLLARGLLTALLFGAAIMASVALSDRMDSVLRNGSLTALFDPDQVGVQRGLSRWFHSTGRWVLIAWFAAWSLWGLACGVFFPHWRIRWVVIGVPLVFVGSWMAGLGLLAIEAWGLGDPIRDVWRDGVPRWRTGRFLLVFGAAGFGLGLALFRVGHRIERGRRKGLGSRRLRRVRRKKLRQS